jgi:O-antigen biosynthesis protein
MEFSGEQFIPKKSSKRLEEEHRARYDFILQDCRGKKVLDIACGSGFGSNMLAQQAESVIGADISRDAIAYAKKSYARDNLTFIEESCAKAVFEQGKFDVIASFETIEHLDADERKKFLELCAKHLKSEGHMFISTPNKKITSPYTDKPLNKYHKIEFEKAGLKKELEPYFAITEWHGQRFVPAPLAWKYARKGVRLLEIILRKDFGLYGLIQSPEVKSWRNSWFQPRIIFVKMKKI